MHHAGAGLLRQCRGQPFDQLFHAGHGFGFRQAILLSPAIDLAAEIVSGFSKIGKPCRLNVGVVQFGQHIEHLEIDRAPFLRRASRHRTIPDGAAIDHAHHIEPAANHAVIGAQAILARDREPGLIHASLHLIFAIDRMRRRQQWAERLTPENIIARLRLDLVGRVRLPALELCQMQRAFKALHIGLHPFGQAPLIQLVGTFRFDRADKGLFSIHRSNIAH